MMPGQRFSRRRFLRDLGASAAGLGLTGCDFFRGDPPDIVVLVLDSLRACSLPMYGHERNTAPFLADLATRSTLFERCYSAATWTRPSVISILSGMPAQVHRGGSWEIPYPPYLPSFASSLGSAGYRTGFFTANIAIGESFSIDSQFEHVEFGAGKDYDRGPRLTRECETWLQTLDEDDKTLVYIHYHPPHGPYHPPAEFVERARGMTEPGVHHLPHHLRGGADIALAANILGQIPWYQAKRNLSDDLVDYQQRYEANIAFGDSLAAGFFNLWQQMRGERRTIFFVTGDHGEGLGEHGLLCDHGKVLMDEILHVPLLVYDTARPAATRVEYPVSHLDLSATIVDLARVPQRLGMMNQSLFESGSIERVIVSHQEDWRGGESGLALTSGRWRLLYNPGARYGSGNIMEVRAGKPEATTVTGVPLPLPSTTLRRPVEIGGGAILESFACLPSFLVIPADLRFSGTFRSTQDAMQLAIRVRAPGSPPVELGPFTAGDFEGLIPDALGGQAERLIVEAAPWAAEASTRREATWRHLLNVPVFKPRRLSDALEILGCVSEPEAACPGDSVHISLRWRAHQNIGEKVGFAVELVGPDGGATIRETRRFFRHYPGKHAVPRSLIDDGKVGKKTFSSNALDFEDAFWWTLPPTLQSGSYRLKVGLVAYDELFSTGLEVTLSDPVAVGALEVSQKRSEHLRLHARQELGIENLRLPPGWIPTAAEAEPVRALARRFPNQGHLDFLLAGLAPSGNDERELLRACLEKTPFHRPALAQLASQNDEVSRRVLDRLIPSNPRQARFGGVVALSGYDLCVGDSCAYLTLYWRAEAASSLLLAANLSITGKKTEGDSTEKYITWYIGGEQKPTHGWQLGETVVETIRLPIDSAVIELSITLWLGEGWREAYAAGLGPFTVTSGNGKEMMSVKIELGNFPLTELPRCDVDYLARKRSDPVQCVLIDLLEDPEQTADVRLEQPEVFSRLHQQLETVLTLGKEQAPRGDGKEVELSEETKERLRALGYLD
jgi:arylsulfatase A-like enzyme